MKQELVVVASYVVCFVDAASEDDEIGEKYSRGEVVREGWQKK